MRELSFCAKYTILHGGSGGMASIRLDPPEPFNFKKPDDWPRWKRRFEQYRGASGLAGESDSRQVSTLLYCMGESAADILASTGIAAEDREKYSEVIAKFESFFSVRRNVILERAKFNSRNQRDDEPADVYITALYQLVETCGYKPDVVDEMLRDRLVVGMRDKSLAEQLQMDPELTLDKVKRKMRQKEAVKEQTLQLKESDAGRGPMDSVDTNTAYPEARPVDAMQPARSQRGGPSRPRRGRGGTNTTDKPRLCTRCGNERHPTGDRCPAADAMCRRCNRKGHYAARCYSKTVAPAPLETVMDSVFLGSLSGNEIDQWHTTLRIGQKTAKFKMDTGAQVTAISEQTYKRLQLGTLKKPSKILVGPARQSLETLGQVSARLTHGKLTTKQTLFVVKGLRQNLLGLPAITSLHLIQRVGEMASPDDLQSKFPGIFSGLGTFGEEYNIQLKEGAKPYAEFTARGIAIPLRPKVKAELERMESLGVISRVVDHTPWCAGMVVVPKRSGEVRICVDLKELNGSVLREVHPIPKVDETLAQLSGATIFSKLDANSGFWQIPLAAESRLLTTFITPFGRFCFNKLPFGVSCAPELFQRRMSRLLEGLPGVLCLMDDVVVFGANKEEHEARLTETLQRIKDAGVTLNPQKCEFRKKSLIFLGHVVSGEGIQPDPDKTSAIQNMPAPKNVPELRRFLGMTNQMGKFSSQLGEMTQPLRELLSANKAWVWGPSQEEAVTKIKRELSRPTVLALYDPAADTILSADASSYGLGAVLLQKTNSASEWKPVAYASRSMSDTERRYAQIEKEALALTWAAEKFSTYLLGKRFAIETDHKPLVPLLSTKRLDDLPPRILRFRLRMTRFDYTISHVPGITLHTADALSRAPVIYSGEGEELQEEVEAYIEGVVALLPASKHRLQQFREAQAQDPVCSQVLRFCEIGWPDKRQIPQGLTPYWKVRDALTAHQSLLLYKSRIVIPVSLQRETLSQLHEGHQGMERCRMRAQSSVWWPGISRELTDMVTYCGVCAREASLRKEPMMASPLPDYPWQVVGSDLFTLKNTQYLLVVDYFSRYPEIVKLSSTTSTDVITALKTMFARFGIPEVLRSDNGPQYSSEEFSRFMRRYGVQHLTSSPRYPQSNGQAERTVQTVKRLLKKSEDPFLALLSYRATPLPWCNISPAELLMGRRLRTTVPQTDDQLIPKWPYLPQFKRENQSFKEQQAKNFDLRHRTQELLPIPEDSAVWVNTEGGPVPGTVTSPASTPRSYIVNTGSGEIRRNRSHLRVIPSSSETDRGDQDEESSQGTPEISRAQTDTREETPRSIMTRSRTGITLKPPDRLT